MTATVRCWKIEVQGFPAYTLEAETRSRARYPGISPVRGRLDARAVPAVRTDVQGERRMTVRILTGDAREVLKTLPDESVHCVVTSPPYWGLRSYGGDSGMIGLEETLDEHLENLVAVFREVRRVLRKDGTVWLNYGDAYAATTRGKGGDGDGRQGRNAGSELEDRRSSLCGFKPKDLMGLPWRVAFALQDDGWWLRSDVVWHKSNPMPESAKDRPTRAHEFLFLLTKAPRYFYDNEAVKEPVSGTANARAAQKPAGSWATSDGYADQDPRYKKRPPGVTPKSAPAGSGIRQNENYQAAMVDQPATRNLRDVWTFASAPFKGAHFATFPPALVEPCLKAGTSEKGCCSECGAPWERVVETPKLPTELRKREGVKMEYHARNPGGGQACQDWRDANPSRTVDWRPTCDCRSDNHRGGPFPTSPCTVLDPFGGAGTVGLVAERRGRDSILIEINPDYAEMARARIADAPTANLELPFSEAVGA